MKNLHKVALSLRSMRRGPREHAQTPPGTVLTFQASDYPLCFQISIYIHLENEEIKPGD